MTRHCDKLEAARQYNLLMVAAQAMGEALHALPLDDRAVTCIAEELAERAAYEDSFDRLDETTLRAAGLNPDYHAMCEHWMLYGFRHGPDAQARGVAA